MKTKFLPAAASVVVLCFGVILFGCGGSSSNPSDARSRASGPQATQQARPTPSPSNPDVGQAQAQVAPHRHPAPGTQSVRKVGSDGAHPAGQSGKVQRAKPTPAASGDDNNTSSVKPPNPCKLVSISEAQTITGGEIAGRVEAPLGPTCIYSRARSKVPITLAIEAQSFSQVAHHLSKRKAVTVGGHLSYCGRLGTEMLFVPLSGGRVLNVTAPCSIAERFATLAVGRLSA